MLLILNKSINVTFIILINITLSYQNMFSLIAVYLQFYKSIGNIIIIKQMNLLYMCSEKYSNTFDRFSFIVNQN